MTIAQITDTHIVAPGRRVYDRFDTAAALRAAVARLNSLRPAPDVVLVTGDLVHHGTAPEYNHFLELMAGLALPWQAIPGNHDTRGAFLDALGDRLPERRLAGFGQFALDAGPLCVLCLDTLEEGYHNAGFCAERLGWLEAELERARGRPVVIAMHHPPFATGVAWMDVTDQTWAASLEALVARHDNVQAVLCGHVHRPIVRAWGGAVAMVCPSTTYQVGADLDRLEAHMCAEPAAMRLCQWDGTACVSHLLPIETDPDAYEVIGQQVLAQLKAYADAHDGRVPKDVNNRLRKLDGPD